MSSRSGVVRRRRHTSAAIDSACVPTAGLGAEGQHSILQTHPRRARGATAHVSRPLSRCTVDAAARSEQLAGGVDRHVDDVAGRMDHGLVSERGRRVEEDGTPGPRAPRRPARCGSRRRRRATGPAHALRTQRRTSCGAAPASTSCRRGHDARLGSSSSRISGSSMPEDASDPGALLDHAAMPSCGQGGQIGMGVRISVTWWHRIRTSISPGAQVEPAAEQGAVLLEQQPELERPVEVGAAGDPRVRRHRRAPAPRRRRARRPDRPRAAPVSRLGPPSQSRCRQPRSSSAGRIARAGRPCPPRARSRGRRRAAPGSTPRAGADAQVTITTIPPGASRSSSGTSPRGSPGPSGRQRPGSPRPAPCRPRRRRASASERRVSKTRLSAGLLIDPDRPFAPVAAPSTVCTMLARSQGSRGAAYSVASWSSSTSPPARDRSSRSIRSRTSTSPPSTARRTGRRRSRPPRERPRRQHPEPAQRGDVEGPQLLAEPHVERRAARRASPARSAFSSDGVVVEGPVVEVTRAPSPRASRCRCATTSTPGRVRCDRPTEARRRQQVPRDPLAGRLGRPRERTLSGRAARGEHGDLVRVPRTPATTPLPAAADRTSGTGSVEPA